MSVITRRYVLSLLLFYILSACGNDTTSPDDFAFRLSNFVEQIQNTGAKVTLEGPSPLPFFSGTGEVVEVDGQRMIVIEFTTAAAAVAEAALVSPDGLSIGSTAIDWPGTPHFFGAGRTIVIYVGDDEETLNRLFLVMGPQFAGG